MLTMHEEGWWVSEVELVDFNLPPCCQVLKTAFRKVLSIPNVHHLHRLISRDRCHYVGKN